MRKAKQKVNISNTNTNHLQSPPTTTMSAIATAAFAVNVNVNVNPSSRSDPPPASSSLQREEVSTRRRGKKRGHEEAVGTSILSELQNAFHAYAPTDSPVPSHDKPFGAFSKKPRRESHVPVTEFKSYCSKDPYDLGSDEGRTSHRIRQSDLVRINAIKVNPSSRSAPPPASSSLQCEEVSTRRRGKKRGHEEAVGTSILSELQNAFHAYAPTDSLVPSHDKPFGAFSKKPRRELLKNYSSKDPYDRGNDKGRTSRLIRQSDLVRINAEWERCTVDETTVKRVHFGTSHHRILFIPRFGRDSLEELKRNTPAVQRLDRLARRENYNLSPGFAREAFYAGRLEELESRQAEFESTNAQRRADSRQIILDSCIESVEEEDDAMVPCTEDDAAFDAVAFDHIVDESVPLETVVEDNDEEEEEVLLGLDFIEGEDVHKEDVHFDTPVADNLAVELDDDDDEGDFYFIRGDGVAQPERQAGPPMGNIVQSDDDVEDVKFEATVEHLDEDVINIQPRFTKELESTLDGQYWAETQGRTSRRRKQTVFFSPC